jgi:hypothetical protein
VPEVLARPFSRIPPYDEDPNDVLKVLLLRGLFHELAGVMARLIRDGSRSPPDGYNGLSSAPADADSDAAAARKAERSTVKISLGALK